MDVGCQSNICRYQNIGHVAFIQDPRQKPANKTQDTTEISCLMLIPNPVLFGLMDYTIIIIDYYITVNCNGLMPILMVPVRQG